MNGKLRIIRLVARKKDGRVRSVVFSILRCSWTRRPDVTYGRTDLYCCRLRVVKKGYGCTKTWLERVLQKQIENRHDERVLECCDVIGVIT